MATLCLLNEDGSTVQQWEIGDQPVTVGRGAAIDARVDDDGLSRRHFMILREADGYVLKDLSSRNGTWVDGQRQFSARLCHQDRIVAGRSQFRFQEHQADAPETEPRLTGPHDTVIISRSSVRPAAVELAAVS